MKSREWTAKELAWLKANWTTVSSVDAAKHLQRTVGSCAAKAKRLGLYRGETWTPAEIDFLRLTYPDNKNKRIATVLRRKPPEIRKFAESIGLEKAWWCDWAEPDFVCGEPLDGTDTPPGSEARIAIYRQRVEQRLQTDCVFDTKIKVSSGERILVKNVNQYSCRRWKGHGHYDEFDEV